MNTDNGLPIASRRMKRFITEIVILGSMVVMLALVAKVDESTLDEAPQAYKNIFKVMSDQKDLVDVVCHIKPMISVKA